MIDMAAYKIMPSLNRIKGLDPKNDGMIMLDLLETAVGCRQPSRHFESRLWCTNPEQYRVGDAEKNN
jgi:hypothetical protein